MAMTSVLYMLKQEDVAAAPARGNGGIGTRYSSLGGIDSVLDRLLFVSRH